MHIPVLQKEILEYLNPKPSENFIDCTVGEGGHTLAILEKNGPEGKVLGIDRDTEVIQNTKYKIQDTRYKNRLILVCDNFSNLKEIARKEKFSSVSGILFDLGMSSRHLEQSGRGFSFQKNEPLDMRFNIQNPLTAEKIINHWSESEIEKILKEYGEERFSREIAKGIIKARRFKPIEKTFQLSGIIKESVPGWYQRKRLPRRRTFGSLRGRHFATKSFQALRIAVNDELNNLEKALPQAFDILESGGRLAVISFHSLEDRIVKNFTKNKFKAGLSKILTKKPLVPAREEIKINPRSRSAKLRVAQKI